MIQLDWGHLIKQYRLQFGLTQQGVGAQFGVSQKTVSRWESGENRPSLTQQRQFREMVRKPAGMVSNALSAAVKNCPAPRALCLHHNLNLQALSRPALAKRPSMADWIGRDLVPIACGVLADMLEDRALQISILKREIACISVISQSVLVTPGHSKIGTFRTAISFFSIDGTLFRDFDFRTGS